MRCSLIGGLLLAAGSFFFMSCTKEDTTIVETINFESLTVPTSGYWNGADMAGFFQSGSIKFSNTYDAAWQTWSGFAYSAKNDRTTSGYGNQYSVFAAGTSNNHFALFYPPFTGKLAASFPVGETHRLKSMDFCNATYPALSMQNGDSFCKKFGGTSGTDKDWFLVTVKGFDAAGNLTGSVEVYLADFRFTDSSKDFILNNWTPIDLSSLGMVNSFTFEFTSSDTGAYGINTPTYVCVDNIRYEHTPL